METKEYWLIQRTDTNEFDHEVSWTVDPLQAYKYWSLDIALRTAKNYTIYPTQIVKMTIAVKLEVVELT